MVLSTDASDGKGRVLAAINIVELIGQTVRLQKRGSKFVGLCPFHSEKSPSFNVDPGKQFFYCFGCKAGGNALDFVIKRDRLTFVEALKLLAEQTGVELPRLAGKSDASERQRLLDAQSAAAGLFEKLLAHPQTGAAAREYLAGRGFKTETLARFRVGVAPDAWDTLLRSPALKGFPPDELVRAGLAKSRDNGSGFYDVFRNRIIFPIRDEQGRVIAFGGRVAPGSEDPAKYLNSPETPLFSKSRTIYGLDLARQRIVETRTVAIVEGYTDVMMAHQFGAMNVVSVLGTALTQQHVTLLRRFADRIVLLFDADAAGDLAASRALELLLTQPIEITIASMPAGVDPDQFLLQYGKAGFDELLAGAQDALSFTWKQLRSEFSGQDDLSAQQRAVERYLELLASARQSGPVDTLRWGATLARVSRLTEIPAEELHRRFGARRAGASGFAPRTEQKRAAAPALASLPTTVDEKAQRWLLGVLFAEPQRWSQVQQLVHPEDFAAEPLRQLAEIFWNYQRDEGTPAFNELLGLFNAQDQRELALSILSDVEALNNMDQVMNDALEHLKQARVRTDERKLLAELRRKDDQGGSEMNEIELLRRLSDRARQPDVRRSAG